MNPFDDLARKWSRFGRGQLTDQHYLIAVPTDDLTTLQSVYECYPRLEHAEIIRDLLAAALLDMEQSLPYEPGRKVIATDEWGDEIYEDSGLTPRYLSLTRHYLGLLQQSAQPSGSG